MSSWIDKILYYSYEAALSGVIVDCMEQGRQGVPVWFLYLLPIIKFLQVLNAAGNFPIYILMGASFRKAFFAMFEKKA